MVVITIRDFIINLSKSILTIGKVLLLSKKTSKHKVKKVTDSIVVLANGPSLNKMYSEHKEFLAGKDTICVNFFPLSPLYEEIKPRFTITGAPELWRENISEELEKRNKAFYETLARKTTWDCVFFIPCEARNWRKWQDILKKNNHITVFFYNNTPIEGWRWFQHALYNLNLGMPRPHNVLTPTLYVLIKLQYKKVYLWGADHSWLGQISVNENNDALVNQKHFYDENQSKPETMHKGGVGQRKLHEILHKFMKTFESYFLLRDYAESKGCEILNNTEGSFIDAFKRMKL